MNKKEREFLEAFFEAEDDCLTPRASSALYDLIQGVNLNFWLREYGAGPEQDEEEVQDVWPHACTARLAAAHSAINPTAPGDPS